MINIKKNLIFCCTTIGIFFKRVKLDTQYIFVLLCMFYTDTKHMV